MLKAVRQGEVDAVAVTKLSRFGRKRSKLCKILAELQANDVMLITTDVSLRYQLYLYGLDRVIAGCQKGISVQEYIQQMSDGRTRVVREVEGIPVTIYFSEKDDEDILEKVKSMIMDAYAERKLREGKQSNFSPQ